MADSPDSVSPELMRRQPSRMITNVQCELTISETPCSSMNNMLTISKYEADVVMQNPGTHLP